MHRIAKTRELQHELQQLLEYAQSPRPSRLRVADELLALSRRLATQIDVGFKWQSVNGDKEIIQRTELNGREVFMVTEAGQRFPQIISVTEIDREIKFDTAQLEHHTRNVKKHEELASAKALREEEYKKEKREEDRWLGFTSRRSLTPAQKERYIAALKKVIRSNGQVVKIGDLVIERVKQGWVVRQSPSLGRVFEDPKGGALLLQKDLSKIALDFAEYLIDKPSLLR